MIPAAYQYNIHLPPHTVNEPTGQMPLTAWCWDVSRGPAKLHLDPTRPFWSLILTDWLEACTRVAYRRPLCRALAHSSSSSSHKGADLDPAAGSTPSCGSVQQSPPESSDRGGRHSKDKNPANACMDVPS